MDTKRRDLPGAHIDLYGMRLGALQWQVMIHYALILSQCVLTVYVLRRAEKHFGVKLAICAFALLELPGADFFAAMALQDVWL